MKKKFNKLGRLTECIWDCNIIYDNAVLEQYLTSRDKSLIDKHVYFKFKGNIFKCFDSNYFLPMFYRNMENKQLILEPTQRTEFSPEFFREYFSNRVIDIPDTYLGKKPKTKKEVIYADRETV